MADSLKISVDLPVSPERVFRAWLDSYEHSQFTGSPAKIDPRVGGKYTAWNGYIRGQTIVKTPFNHIVQSWRTAEFPAGSPDTKIEITIEPTCLGCQFTLVQTGLPDGQASQYLPGWEDYYLRPLLVYFEKQVGDTAVDMDG